MSDILFRYLVMARSRELSFWRRLFIRNERLLEAGVEQLVESASARVDVKSQHERVHMESVEKPASRQHRVTFYDVAQPNRPKPGELEERGEEFPLRATLKEFTCSDCGGSGEVRCRRCRGRGRVRCGSCGGSGSVSDGNRRHTCGRCGGSGKRTCFSCHGSGWKTCGRCDGEGRLASWDSEVYEWLIENRAGETYPHDDSRLRRAFHKWLEDHPDQVESFTPEAAADHLGFETRAALEIVERADANRQRLEEEARQSENRYLFHHTTCALSPTGYTVVRAVGRKARYYWLVGRGEDAREIKPIGSTDGRKLLGWLGFGSSGTFAWEGGVRLTEALTSEILDPLQIFLGFPAPLLAGGSLVSGLMLLSGVRRLRDRPPPVTTLGLLPASGRPTPWLTCLAYLGSYAERLTVLDRAYDTQLERLLGKMRPARQSESLTVEMLGGRRIRLIELARPERLSDGQLDLTLRALDGIMIVEQESQNADALEARLRKIAENEEDVTPIHRIAIDRAGSDEAVPVEAIRKTFVEDLDSNTDWNSAFDRLWQPLERLTIAVDAVVPGLTGAGR